MANGLLQDFSAEGDYINKQRVSDKSDSLEGMNEYTIHPYTGTAYSKRGVLDLTNTFQFAPFESGYCMLAVLSSPTCLYMKPDGTTNNSCYNYYLQKAFVKMLEDEFKGLDGIEDITADTMEFSNGVTTTSRISKVNQPLQQTLSMRYTEKTGTLITKYLSTYLKTIKDPRTQVRTYASSTGDNAGFHREVFNMIYIITDSTCLRVEKAFLLLNAFPINAPYSDLFNTERGDISAKEITINFMANVVDGKEANRIARAYIQTLVNLSAEHESDKINLNSSDFNYSFSDGNGRRRKIKDIKVAKCKDDYLNP